jgi:quercetin dioxygenase-like cupin family protein
MSLDPVQVAPHAFKVILENERVRVLESRLEPGDRTTMHSHPPNVVYSITDSTTKFTARGEKARVTFHKAGTAIWEEAGSHATENVGTTTAHNIVIELKH